MIVCVLALEIKHASSVFLCSESKTLKARHSPSLQDTGRLEESSGK